MITKEETYAAEFTVRVEVRSVLVKMVEKLPEYDVRVENDVVFAKSVEVVRVLVKRVEKSPTFTAREDIVPFTTFIEDACIVEKVGEPEREPSVEKNPEFAFIDEILQIFSTCRLENCAALPCSEDIVSLLTFRYGVDQKVPPCPSAVRTKELGITVLLSPRAKTVRSVILSESSVLRALALI